MTKEEIRIQTALGTIAPNKLSIEDQKYWINIKVTRALAELNNRENIRQAAGQGAPRLEKMIVIDSLWHCFD